MSVIKKLRGVMLILMLSMCSVAIADVQGDMVNFFDSMGWSGNATSSSSYQGQEAGYYSAGSVFLRNASSNLNLIQVSVPSMNAGCGGIDIFGGGLSFINSQYLTEFFQNVMQSAAGYLFNLALKTEVPEISEALDEAQSWAQSMNNQNLSSCQMAQDMIGGLLPQTQASTQQVCQDVGSQDNMFSDWTSARLNCGQENNASGALNKASTNPTYQKMVPYNTNVVWQAIQEIDGFQNDHQLAELVMSLTGTAVFDSKGHMTTSTSLLSDQLIKTMMYGGTSQIYVCDDSNYTQCLTLAKQPMTISASNGFVSQTMTMLDNLTTSLQNDQPLTNAEKGFLNLTTLPVLKLVEVSLSSGQAGNVSQYADLIAANILEQYLQQLLTAVKAGLAGTSYAPAITQMVQNSVNASKQTLNAYASKNEQAIQNTIALITQSQQLEKQVSAQVSGQTKSNLAWGSE